MAKPYKIVKLLSTAGTGFFYTTTVRSKGAREKKLELRKYDPVIRKHVLFKEAKIS